MPYNLTGYNVINGTPADETIIGTALNDAIYGNGGADMLNGGLGADVLFGGPDGNVVFVYNPDGIWANVNAINTGDPGYPGTGTNFPLTGYGQSYDVFVGSGTNNTLAMPDGAQALFLEDGLSPGVDSIRLVNIQKIIAGNGGQVIDLTSSTATYGNVTIIGGSGNDVLMANAGADLIQAGDGDDYLWGGSGSDTLRGGAGNDRILGAVGNDVLDGGTGNDTMIGGVGNDTYFVDSTSDIVTENANEGTDTVHSAINYTLGSNLENLTLTGIAISGTGNSLNNIIIGNASNNVLNGGTGADTLRGGLGNDTYVVDNVGDVVVELAGEGIDTVNSSVSYVLGADLENLVLTGSAAINGTGNALNNVITGNSGANIINGGAGDDTMQGGGGNDTYHVDSSLDVVIENSGGGTDHVLASASFVLGANIENLTLTAPAISTARATPATTSSQAMLETTF
jgi:trimeric autotransporter adhesin